MSVDPNFNKFTYEHYLCFPDDGKRHEIIDGEHYMDPAPSTNRQTISRRLHFQLYEQIELKNLGQVFDAPTDVRLTDFDVVQPDIIVILNENLKIIKPAKINGAPDMVIEIISPSTAKNDRTLKMQLYQKCGVNEYWLVDPGKKEIQQYVLKDQQYSLHETGDEIGISIIENVIVDTTKLW